MPDLKYVNDLFHKTWPCDGFNAVDEVFDSADLAFLAHPITKLTSILASPNRPILGKNQSWLNIGANLLGLFPAHSPLRYLNYTGIVPLIFLIWNLVTIIPKLTLNIAKVFTEFLPAFVAQGFRELGERHFKNLGVKSRHPLLKVVDYLIVGVAAIAEWVSDGIFLLGRCITSPVKSMRMALHFAEERFGSGTAGKVVGVLLLGLSLVVTATVYVLLFPLVAQVLAPYIASIAPAWAINAYALIQPYLAVMGAAVETVIGATLLPAVTGLGAAIGFMAATIGSALSRLIEKSINWVYHGHGSIQEKVQAKLKKDVVEGYDDSDDEHSMKVVTRVAQVIPKNSNTKSASKDSRFFVAKPDTSMEESSSSQNTFSL